MDLSIIVPVYNMAGDGKLNFCLDSLVGQDFDGDYEIICVDDHSSDDSVRILKEYESLHPGLFRIIVNERNMHQGGARNAGMKAASGKWIGFLDSDDWVSKDYYRRLVTLGEETGADVVGCCYSMVSEHTFEVGKISRDHLEDASGEMTPERRKAFLNNMSSMVTKVYRASLIRDNDLSFPEDIFYEDNAAGPVWAMCYKHFEYIDEPLYYYYQHDTSTVHTITEKRCEDRMSAGEFMLSEMKRRGFLEEYHDEIENIFTTVYFVNTLFSYMRMKNGRSISVVKHLRKRMIEEFPDFRKNRNYGRYMDDEQKAYVDLLMKSSFAFYVKYSLLWWYRDLRSKSG
ncbi:MAG: glycosyltransferase family 2 protein [Lachnospiraceae bacterium]|nr:glycosyltransferase family 2 protein [Lachnospiraceae bacterium]